MGVRTKKSNFYMEYGTLGHCALAYFYAQRMERKPKWFIDFPDAEKYLERDALGNDDRLHDVKQLMEFYAEREKGEPLNAIYCEEEWEATIGEVDPDGKDEPAEDIEYVENGEKKVWHHCALNDEVITCRPDIIAENNGVPVIYDHKVVGINKKTGRLTVMNPQYPDLTYHWQAAFNLLVVSKGRCTEAPGARLPVEEFVLNRVSRGLPHDVSRDKLDLSPMMVRKLPATVRDAIRRSRILKKKALLDPKSLVANFSACNGQYACDYIPLCYSNSVAERDAIAHSQFTFPGSESA